MDPASLLVWLTKAGPYAVTAIVLVWLKLERAERLAAQEDARKLRDERAADLKEGAEALAELGEATRRRIREHDDRIEEVLTFVRRGDG